MTCRRCGSRLLHNAEYDARFCPECGEWAEARCMDRACDFCSARPDKPPVARVIPWPKERRNALAVAAQDYDLACELYREVLRTYHPFTEQGRERRRRAAILREQAWLGYFVSAEG